MKNKNTSPLFALGQGITNYEDYKALAFVGAPVDFTGQALVQLGALISQQDADRFAQNEALEDPTTDEAKKIIEEDGDDENTEKELFQSIVGDVGEDEIVDIVEVIDDIDDDDIEIPLNNPKKVGGGNLPSYKTAYNNMSPKAQATYTKLGKAQGISGFEFYQNQQEGMPKEQKEARESVRLWASKNLSKGQEFDVNNPAHVTAYKNSPEYNPLGLMGKGQESNPDLNQNQNTDTDPNQNQNKNNKTNKEFTTLDYLGLRGIVDNIYKFGDYLPKATANKPSWAKDYYDSGIVEQRRKNPIELQNEKNSTNKRLKPEILKIIKNSVYDRKGKRDTRFQRVAHVLTSPFHRTDNVSYKYLRRAVMPKYAQQNLGSAAAEGYNLRVDAMNYNRAVKASFDSDLEKEIGSLDVPAPSGYSTSNQRNDLLQIGLDSKKELAEAFNSYAIKGEMSKLEYEQLKDKLQARVGNIAASIKVFNGATKTYMENKDKIDPDASDTKMMDFYETLEKAPESIGIKEIDGSDYFVGTTIAGKEFKISVSQVANGNAKFQLTEKADAAKISADVLKDMLNQKQEVKTAQGFGLAQYTDDSTEGEPSFIRNLAENKLIQLFNTNPDTARSIASQVANMDFDAYQNAIGRDINGDGIVDNTEIKENEKLLYQDLASEFYNIFIKDIYNPQTFTTQRTTTRGGGSRGSGGRGTAAERNRQLLGQLIGNLPPVSVENGELSSRYKTFLDTKYRTKIEDGKLIIGDGKKKIDEISLTDPNFKARFSKYTALPSYIQNNTQVSNQDPLAIL